VPGGCPVLNTAIEADDGNPVLRAHAAKALRFWLSRLQAIVEQARKRGETRPGVDPKAVATVIVASLEGGLDDEPPAAEGRAAPYRPVGGEGGERSRGRRVVAAREISRNSRNQGIPWILLTRGSG